MTEELLPEMLSAAALAAYFCSTEDGWEKMEEWARREGIVLQDEKMSREVMKASSHGIKILIKQVEIELFKARIRRDFGV